ncbi:MAG: hypothetical protein ACKOE6_13725 [Flammeovirgaceae bacterium]
MRALRLVGVIVLALVVHQAAWAQSKPEAKLEKADTAIQKINAKQAAAQSRVDSLQKKATDRLDTVHVLEAKANSKLDSLQKLSNQPMSKLDSAQRSLMGKLEQRQKRLQQQIDSLRIKKLPTAQLEARAKKLSQSFDSLRQKIKLPDTQKIAAKATELQSTVSGKANKVSATVTEGLADKQKDINQAVSKLTDGKVTGLDKNVSMPNMPQVNLPNTGSNVLPNTNTSLPNLNTNLPAGSNAGVPTVPGGNVNVPGVNGVTVPNAQMPAAPNLNTSLQLPTDQIKGAQGQVKAYSGEMQKIREGRIDSAQVQKLAEQHADLKELKKIREQEAAISKYKQMSERYRDPEAMKKELEQKSKAIANEKLEENKVKVQSAVGDLKNAKTKYGSFENMDQLPKKRYNPWREKTFAERLVPAVGLQVQTKRNLWLDVAPHVGYRINQRWLAGIGWNERVSMNFDRGNYYIASERVYGPRAHGQFQWGKVTFRADVECLNTYLKDPAKPTDLTNRGWVWSCFVGIKQNFKITKKLNGYAQVAYNIYNPSNQSPYNDRLALRFGFELPSLAKREIPNQ